MAATWTVLQRQFDISLLGVSFAGPAIREWPKMFALRDCCGFCFATVRLAIRLGNLVFKGKILQYRIFYVFNCHFSLQFKKRFRMMLQCSRIFQFLCAASALSVALLIDITFHSLP